MSIQNNNNTSIAVPTRQRALVLQGGGALGAYDAGVFQALYDKIDTSDGRPLFDIIAGTSSGAMNAAILVSNVIEKGWDYAARNLNEFWDYVATVPYIQNTPAFSIWWANLHAMNPNAASEEAARRYYSAKQFQFTGVQNVFSSPILRPDLKFFDDTIPWPVYSNQPLKDSLEKYARFPIATSSDLNQPRLLLTTVDVQESTTVTFDSYVKEDGTRKSEYGNKNGKYQYVINYDQGITSDFAIASGSVAINYDYARIPTITVDNNNNLQTVERYFWDGGILSNTPLRELIQAHQDYWLNVKGKGRDGAQIPQLDIYIVDVWPTKIKDIPMDHDGVIDRYFDLLLDDKTDYDEIVANIVSDYIDFVKQTRDLAVEAINTITDASKKNTLQKKLEKILKIKAKSIQRTGEQRTYQDLLKGRFSMNVTRIDRTDNVNDISNKLSDYSTDTLRELRQDGYNDTLKVIQK
ncbi:MAG TPA: patatin-like phospholipase family protein [Candidatus Bathyarchaeia archaeon]|nr:patatin-like phospholipase family protein [Candidatus Bathyarchaeia archaeon]